MNDAQHIGGQRRLSNSHAKNMIDYPHLTFNGSPDFDKIYSKWNETLEPFSKNIKLSNDVAIGNISKNLSLDLLKSLRNHSMIKYGIGDCSLDYVASCIKPSEAAQWAEGLEFFDVQENLDKINLILEEIQPFVKSHIGNFKLINVKAWDTLSIMPKTGPLNWHKDSLYPTHTYKIFIYPNGADKDKGTTKFMIKEQGNAIKTIKGDPGVFVLFNPVSIMHCGIAPEKEPRPMIEFILVPWSETIIKPQFNGTNSTHPIDPYY